MLKLDDALLSEYAEGFFGYGTYAAPYWFIGIEEGGATEIADVEGRLSIWNTTRSEVWDIVPHHEAIGGSYWFSGRPPLQRTWNKLIRTLLSAKRDPLFGISAARTPHLLKDRTE